MNQCENIQAQMAFYLDDELRGSEVTALETHLAGCKACGELFDSERRFLDALREFNPLNTAPPELRARVEKVLSDAPSVHAAPAHLPGRIRRVLAEFSSSTSALISSRRVPALIGLVTIVALVGVWYIWKENRAESNAPSEFAMMAVDNHRRHLRGQLPLETTSDAPEQISKWFAGKVPFLVTLPNYQESSGQEKLYDLEGARLVGYKNDYAAYVAYQMHKRPISLVMTSDAVAQPSGGEKLVFKGMTFHYDSINGLKVITWSDRGLTYALVSDLEERGQQSCILCHQGTKDQDIIQGLKPR